MNKTTILSLFLVLVLGCNAPQKTEKGFFKSNLATSENGLEFIRDKEGFSEIAYFDGTWTIGYGNTFYPDGSKVSKGDRITENEANKILKYVISENFEPQINKMLKVELNQSQFDAVCSYSYNRGVGAFKNSNLLKLINHDPNDKRIEKQFVLEWGKNQRFKQGLIRRRKQEAELYFSETATLQETEEKPKNNLIKWVILIFTIGFLAGFLVYLFRLKWSLQIKIVKNT